MLFKSMFDKTGTVVQFVTNDPFSKFAGLAMKGAAILSIGGLAELATHGMTTVAMGASVPAAIYLVGAAMQAHATDGYKSIMTHNPAARTQHNVRLERQTFLQRLGKTLNPLKL